LLEGYFGEETISKILKDRKSNDWNLLQQQRTGDDQNETLKDDATTEQNLSGLQKGGAFEDAKSSLD